MKGSGSCFSSKIKVYPYIPMPERQKDILTRLLDEIEQVKAINDEGKKLQTNINET
jgi:hypothetical protein